MTPLPPSPLTAPEAPTAVEAPTAPSPVAAVPLGYAGGVMLSPECRLALRVLAILGCVVAAARVVAGLSSLGLLVYSLVAPGSPMMTPLSVGLSILPGVLTMVPGILLGVGSFIALGALNADRTVRGTGLMVVAEWIALGLAALRLLAGLVTMGMYFSSAPGSLAWIINSQIGGMASAVVMAAYSLAVILLVGAMRRATTR